MGKRKDYEADTKTEASPVPKRLKESKTSKKTPVKDKKEPVRRKGKDAKTESEKKPQKRTTKAKVSEHRASAVTEEEVEEEQPEGGEDDLSPEEKRVLERKMKKLRNKEEKNRMKAEGKTVKKHEMEKASATQLALEYLTCWSEKRKEWRFQKTRQTWLLQHMFDTEKIPEEHFAVLLSYLEGLKGGARDTTVQKAEALVRELEGEGAQQSDGQQRAQRAREVVQLLS
ncbi:protein cholesin isoform X3 [Paramormyrops kingsleyae]|nr:uncharacterized protein C7orf50 homolog isoform X3 [Paramormyrops kingsleyae]XP_023663849.1 uncharacterized protein C7orf50 homolog isoform X3 [Paramormyrops kingsleyae]XP_023663850.1 uncharacterized protein C7orf50 homolog isoform X3 [Paramormyrops kingsleyae]